MKSKLTICARAENRAGFFRDRGSSLPGAPPPGCVSGPRIGGETDELVRARIGARSREREATPVHRLVTLSASRPTATKDDDLADVAAVRPFSGPSTYLFPPLALFVLLVTSEQAVEVDGSSPQAACDGGFPAVSIGRLWHQNRIWSPERQFNAGCRAGRARREALDQFTHLGSTRKRQCGQPRAPCG